MYLLYENGTNGTKFLFLFFYFIRTSLSHRLYPYSLQKDGSQLPDERHSVSGGNLIISNLVETDRGMYECSATNEAATITAETELMIENIAPRPPYNLTANSTETAITVRWHPGEFKRSL